MGDLKKKEEANLKTLFFQTLCTEKGKLNEKWYGELAGQIWGQE